jgi:hypothetical protein
MTKEKNSIITLKLPETYRKKDTDGLLDFLRKWPKYITLIRDV